MSHGVGEIFCLPKTAWPPTCFVDHAPEAVVNKEKEKKADYESQLAGVRERIQDLKESK